MSRARGFLAALVLENRRVVVIGSSAEAAARAQALLDVGARVAVFANAPSAELEGLAAGGGIVLETRPIADSDLADAWLVVVADRAPELVARLGPRCSADKTLFLAVDQPAYNSVNHVAVARAGAVSVAVATDGSAPALAKRLREELERVFREAGLADWAAKLARKRERTPEAERRRVLAESVAGVKLGALELPDGDDETT